MLHPEQRANVPPGRLRQPALRLQALRAAAAAAAAAAGRFRKPPDHNLLPLGVVRAQHPELGPALPAGPGRDPAGPDGSQPRGDPAAAAAARQSGAQVPAAQAATVRSCAALSTAGAGRRTAASAATHPAPPVTTRPAQTASAFTWQA